MNRQLKTSWIAAAGIIYVIVGIIARSGTVWEIGALVFALIAVLTSTWGRNRV